MAMTPQELQRMEKLEKLVISLYRVENVEFIKNINRRVEFPTLRLSDLSDVSDTDGASTGQVLKKTATTWQPGTDNTGA
jgi:hypothetical protein